MCRDCLPAGSELCESDNLSDYLSVTHLRLGEGMSDVCEFDLGEPPWARKEALKVPSPPSCCRRVPLFQLPLAKVKCGQMTTWSCAVPWCPLLRSQAQTLLPLHGRNCLGARPVSSCSFLQQPGEAGVLITRFIIACQAEELRCLWAGSP